MIYDLKVKCLNVDKGITNYDKLMAIKQFSKQDDILLLQETRGYRTECLWKKYLGRKGKFSFFKENARGVAALIREPFDVVQTDTDQNGRISSVLARQGDFTIGVISFYLPNVSSTLETHKVFKHTLNELKQKILVLREHTENIIAGGDLNIILDAALDAEKLEATVYQDLVEEVYGLLEACNMSDAFRVLHPEAKVFTFSPRGANPHKVFRRLDYCFVSDELVPYLEKVSIDHCHVSDHKAVNAHFSFKEKMKIRNFWRHNDELLDIPEYIEHIEQSTTEGIEKFCNETGGNAADWCDPRKLWEFLKYYLGMQSRKFSKELRIQKDKDKKKLTEELVESEKDPVNNGQKILELRNSLNMLQMEEDKRVIFQARVSWAENNEKPTNFFMRKIKQNFLESNIIELIKDGIKLTKEECNNEIYTFYKDLYALRENVEPNGRLQEALKGLPKLSPTEREALGRPITLAEVSTTLFSRMNTGKSPGNDGLTVAFYKKFWSSLKNYFLSSLAASIEIGELTESQKKSIIRLIQKKGRDPSLIKNWRPISLLNVDTKIFSRLITARVEKHIGKLVSNEQLAYVKGRNIMEGNRTIEFMTEHLSKTANGAIVCFDFEKAYDSIDHQFIRAVLRNFGFPEKFIHLFNTLYKGAESAVLNNGSSTKYFPLERSCRQGDCLSPFLFILALEPLIRMIKSDTNVTGFSPMNHKIKISVYADDITGFVQDGEDLKALIHNINTFGKSSGLTLNLDKTEALHISKEGRSGFSDPELRNIQFVRFIKVTGITHGRVDDRVITEKVNFEEALTKMRNNFNSWNRRDLSILGRVMLAKYHGIAMLQYLASSIEVPEWVIQRAKQMIYKFVHKGVDKITRRTASRPLNCGGINLPILDDMVAAAAVQWLRKARVNSDRLWAKFIHRDINKLGGLGCLNAIRRSKDNQKDGIFAFNQYLMKCWKHLKKEEPMNETTFLSQTVWGNQRFSFTKGKCVVLLQSKLLLKMGYSRVGDFIDQDGRVIEAEGAYTSAFSLRLKMEWALVIKQIKRHLKNLHYAVESGYTDVNVESFSKSLHNHEIFISDGENQIELAELTQSRILKTLAKQRKDTAPYVQRLMEEFKISDEEISNCFRNITQIGYATKTRSFFFKMYAGLLYGNNKLHAFGYANSKSCERCGCPVQDLNHMLIECPIVQNFREAVYAKLQLTFTKREELLGNDCRPYSFILLHMNRYIYQRKYLKLPLNHNEFYAMLNTEKQVEYAIAIKNKSTSRNNRKWQLIHSTGILN